MPIIIGSDLSSAPGAAGTPAATLDYLAEAASSLVEDAWATPIEPTPRWVIDLARDAALRALWNPKGLEMLTRQIDDAKRTEQYDKAQAGRIGVYLTDDERARLGGTFPGTRVGTIRTQPTPYARDYRHGSRWV